MEVWAWIGFIIFVLAMLAVDLGVVNRRAHVISTREALTWASVCVVFALLFNGLVFFIYEYHWLGIGLAGDKLPGEPEGPLSGERAAIKFLTGWLIEQSLSLDNIFVIALIFQYFAVPLKFQHRTLFWGILGALAMRGIMIGLGAALIERFHWIIYVFGALLLLTAYKMYRVQDQSVEPERNPFVRVARRLYTVTPDFDEQKFFTHMDGRRTITPLFLVLLVIESTDVLFAVDSIPAIFAITTDPFLVFTSNVFAILNLRSLYFVLAGAMDRFRYLKPALVFILAFVGVKMIISGWVHIPPALSLVMVVGILAVGMIASVVRSPDDKAGTSGGFDARSGPG